MQGKDKNGRRKSKARSWEEIPEVLRDRPTTPSVDRSLLPLMASLGLISSGILIILAVLMIWRPFSFLNNGPVTSASPNTSPTPESSPTPEVDNVLGHLPYPEAPASELKPITPDGRIRLRTAAAKQFLQMQRDAKANGISLVPISGFRGINEQDNLFFGVKQQRSQDARKRAEVSAPPGYSEHHTGYAIDIGDGRNSQTHLSQRFEQTPAFKWLDKNAARYSFEMSFTPNNPQGVSYEPWHWRYVGDRDSLETFYKARSLSGK